MKGIVGYNQKGTEIKIKIMWLFLGIDKSYTRDPRCSFKIDAG